MARDLVSLPSRKRPIPASHKVASRMAGRLAQASTQTIQIVAKVIPLVSRASAGL